MAKVYAIVCTTGASVRDGQGKSGPWSMQKAFFFKIKDHLLYHLYRVFSKILFTNETNEINIQ